MSVPEVFSFALWACVSVLQNASVVSRKWPFAPRDGTSCTTTIYEPDKVILSPLLASFMGLHGQQAKLVLVAPALLTTEPHLACTGLYIFGPSFQLHRPGNGHLPELAA